jgi:hypothetical protein
MQNQQPQLIDLPIPMQCFHCASTQATVLRDREIACERRYPGTDDCICCTPNSDYHCPVCNSGKLQFAMHYASRDYETGYDDGGEVYRCEACGATGEVEEAAPPVEPWAELEAVAEGGFWVPGDGAWQTLKPTAISQHADLFIKEVA